MPLDKVAAKACTRGESALKINRCPRNQFAKICAPNGFVEQVKKKNTVAKDGHGETTAIYRDAFSYFHIASHPRRADGYLSPATRRCYGNNFAAFFDETGEHTM